METKVQVTIDLEDLAYSVDREDVFTLISLLDLRMADSDFTLSIIKHLVNDIASEQGVSKENVLDQAFAD